MSRKRRIRRAVPSSVNGTSTVESLSLGGYGTLSVVSKKRRPRRWKVGKRENPSGSKQSQGRKGQRLRAQGNRHSGVQGFEKRVVNCDERKGVGSRAGQVCPGERNEVWWRIATIEKGEGKVCSAVGKARERRRVRNEADSMLSKLSKPLRGKPSKLSASKNDKALIRAKRRGSMKRSARARAHPEASF
jgi:hypothetical protein